MKKEGVINIVSYTSNKETKSNLYSFKTVKCSIIELQKGIRLTTDVSNMPFPHMKKKSFKQKKSKKFSSIVCKVLLPSPSHCLNTNSRSPPLLCIYESLSLVPTSIRSMCVCFAPSGGEKRFPNDKWIKDGHCFRAQTYQASPSTRAPRASHTRASFTNRRLDCAEHPVWKLLKKIGHGVTHIRL